MILTNPFRSIEGLPNTDLIRGPLEVPTLYFGVIHGPSYQYARATIFKRDKSNEEVEDALKTISIDFPGWEITTVPGNDLQRVEVRGFNGYFICYFYEYERSGVTRSYSNFRITSRVYDSDGKLVVNDIVMPPGGDIFQCGPGQFAYVSDVGVVVHDFMERTYNVIDGHYSEAFENFPFEMVYIGDPCQEKPVDSYYLDIAKCIDACPSGTASGGVWALYEIGHVLDYTNVPCHRYNPDDDCTEEEKEEALEECEDEPWPTTSVLLLAEYNITGDIKTEYIFYGKGFVPYHDADRTPDGLGYNGSRVPFIRVSNEYYRPGFGDITDPDRQPEHKVADRTLVIDMHESTLNIKDDWVAEWVRVYGEDGGTIEPLGDAEGARNTETGEEVAFGDPQSRYPGRAHDSVATIVGTPPWDW